MSSSIDELVSGVRFGKFASVGAIGAVFDLTVSTVLTIFFGVLAEYAKLVGAEVAIVVMFLINDNWTFAEHGTAGRYNALKRFVKSNLVRSGGVAVQFFIVRGLRLLDFSLVVAGFDLWTVLPFPIAIGASMFFNYVAESLFTWRVADR
jgi:putative flippase GtrA